MRLRGWFLWFVLAALVAAPAIGLMHRVVHGPQVAIGHEQAAAQDHSHEDADCDHGGGWVAALFAAHDDDSSCRLYDQLTHSDALPAAAAALLALLPALLLLRRYDGAARARWAALYDARGPPRLR